MASSKEFLKYVLEQFSDRPMMGEYVLYAQGKVVGGIYDDRFLLKKTKSAMELLKDAEEMQTAIPYEGAKEMLAVDIDDIETVCRLIEAIVRDLPEKKREKR